MEVSEHGGGAGLFARWAEGLFKLGCNIEALARPCGTSLRGEKYLYMVKKSVYCRLLPPFFFFLCRLGLFVVCSEDIGVGMERDS